ncbi:MAG: ABC transporter ATP-binding protein [Deltaproteobacteria bacterium]|nr:MAG: ABC transporter ATP-binding protein [Deltaproteobacteria bacterium]
MIRLVDLRKSYPTPSGPLPVLRGIDLHVPKGQLAAIMGSSGSGKSTLLHVLGILDGYDAGSYHLAGRHIAGLSEADAARLRSRAIGFVFQSFHLLGHKDATENVALPLYYQGVPRAERLARARRMLERVGLGDRLVHLPSQLSGGQKQRVAIARALVSGPDLVLADEPTGALDSHTSAEIMQLLREINAEGVTMVVVTHEHDIAAACDRVIELEDGRIIADRAGAGLAS